MRQFLEILASIPFVGIIVTIFTGAFGWQPPVAFLLQLALQICCGFYLLQLPLAGSLLLTALLVALHFGTGLTIAVQTLSGLGPQPTFDETPAGYVKLALKISLVASVIAAGIIGIACLASSTGFATFALTVLVNTVGSTLIHLFGVVLPMCKLIKTDNKQS